MAASLIPPETPANHLQRLLLRRIISEAPPQANGLRDQHRRDNEKKKNKGGGEMISKMLKDYSTYDEPPSGFEVRTLAIRKAVGLGAADDYLLQIDMHKIYEYKKELVNYLYESLLAVPSVGQDVESIL